MYRRVPNQPLLMRQMQKGPMIHTRILRHPTPEHLRIPRIDMAIEVNHTDLTPPLKGIPKRRQGCSVIPAQYNNPRRPKLTRIRRPPRYHPVRLVQLPQCERVVQERQRRVSAVNDLGPLQEAVLARVDAPGEVGGHARGALADAAGAEACAGARGDAGVERGAEEGDIVGWDGGGGGEAVDVREVSEGGEAGEGGVGGYVYVFCGGVEGGLEGGAGVGVDCCNGREGDFPCYG